MAQQPFGEALRDLILKRYPSQRRYAQEIGMGPEYLSRILRGHVGRPEDETLGAVRPVRDVAGEGAGGEASF